MGCSRKVLLLIGVAPAALWVFCSLLLLQSTGTSAASAAGDFSGFRSSYELIYEARKNMDNWLDYVHATSDPEDEPWVDEYEVGDSVRMRPLKGHDKGKFRPRRTIRVAQDGSGHFTSIQAAIDDIPRNNKERVLIKVAAGVYREKVKISKPKRYITIEGERPAANDGSELRTIITYNATAANLGENGLPLKTFGSATFAVQAKNFIAKYISFKNTAPKPMPGALGGQAVALRVSADKAAFYGCRFYGKQDTLYDHHGRHFFKNCYAEGTIDFIFGNGRSLYQGCHLNALANNGIPGTMTAQSRNTSSLATGFSFVSSMITGYGSAYLGRAWGNDSRVVFANTFMSKVVIPQGWNNWGIAARDRSVFYAEYNCTGPGANSTGRVNWAQQLTYRQAKPFLSIGFINGKKWLQNPIRLEHEELAATAAEAETATREQAHDSTTGQLMAPTSQPSWTTDSPPDYSQQAWKTSETADSDHDTKVVAMTEGADDEKNQTGALWFPLSWLYPH